MEEVKEEQDEENDEQDYLNVEENDEYDCNMYFPLSVKIGDDENQEISNPGPAPGIRNLHYNEEAPNIEVPIDSSESPLIASERP